MAYESDIMEITDTARALIDAVAEGDVERVRRCLAEEPAALRAKNADGATPILFAVYRNRAEVLRVLLDAAVELTIFEAAAVGDCERVRAIIDREDALLSGYSSDGWTALHLAAFFGHVDCVRFLLQRGADVEAVSRNAMHNRPIHAASAGGHAETLSALLAGDADPNAHQAGGYTALHAAAKAGDAAMVGLLMAAGADPLIANDAGQIPADLAADPALAERLRVA